MLNINRLLVSKWKVRLYVVLFLALYSLDASAGKVNPGRSAAIPFTISLDASDFNGFNVSCNGAADGSIDMTINGGLAPFVITWSNGQITEDISGLVAGTYTVTVFDDEGDTQTGSITIIEPAVINAAGLADNVTCNGLSNGSINLTPIGGTGIYTFQWSNAAITEDVTGLAPNTYTVTVTDQNSCTGSSSFIISEPAVLSVNAVVDSVNCNAGSDGSINITASGGTVNYVYLWNGGSASEDLTNLSAGTYTVTVTDANSCTAQQTYVVSEPTAVSVSVSKTDASCLFDNGSATANPSGGTGAYSYNWSNGQLSQSISSLDAGTYTVTVTDINGCTGVQSVNINDILGPSVLSSTIDSVSCFGGNDGSINLTVVGGSLINSYNWSDGGTVEDRNALAAGMYTVTITDILGCTTIQSFTVSQPAAVNATTSSTPAGCALSNGSASVLASGGTGGYQYQWSSGATTSTATNLSSGIYTVTVTDINGCTTVNNATVSNAGTPVIALDSAITPSCFGSTNGAIYITVTGGAPPYSYVWSNGALTDDITNLAAGTYTVTVTDSLGCVDSLDVTLIQPAVLGVAFTVTDPSCGLNNGSITANPTGGTSPYTYQWSNGFLTQAISNLAAGTYTVTVTDNKGCIISGNTTIVQQASPQIITDSVVNVSCFGGSNGNIYISITSGTAPFRYQWSDGSFSQDLLNLITGNYTVTVTDTLGCTATQSFSITQPAAPLSGSFNNVAASCNQNNGASTVNPAGGTGPYTFLWSNGQTTQTAFNLASGPYTVTITDSKLCTVALSTNVPASAQPVINPVVITDVLCNGESNGAINITVTGGTTPYRFLWSNGNVTEDISGLTAGTYTVTVTDTLNCSVTQPYTVQQPAAFSATFNTVNASCGLNNGRASIIVAGGTIPYGYLWSTGASADSIFNQPAGTYTVTVTDSHLCDSVFQVVIGSSPGHVAVVDSVVHINCSGNTTGAIYISVSGGQPPYQYIWSDNSTNQDLINVAAGIYTVTVTDGGLCSVSLTDTIIAPPPLGYNLTSTDATCNQNNGTATINNLSGGTSPYIILWSNGDTGLTADSLAGGMVSVTVTDAAGCSRTDSTIINSAGGPQVQLISLVEPSCFGGSDGSLEIDITTSSPPIAILWSNGDNTTIADSLSAGSYNVTVTDNNGCSSVNLYILTQPDSFSVSFNVINASCGLSNGTAAVLVSGATPGYTFLWSNGDTGATADSLGGNTYTVTVTDANFCSVVRSVSVGMNPAPSVVIDNIIDVSCFAASDGGINITASGGTPPLTYLWSNTATTEDLSGVSGGTYTVTVTDNAGCTTTVSGFVNEATDIVINSSVTNAACGNSTGAVSITVSGGVPGYTFLWSNTQTTQNISNLFAATYTITVTDIAGCTKQAVAVVGNIDGPQISLASHQMVSCNGGNNGFINVSISGGATPYTFLWSNNETTQNISGLSPGIYTLTVTDNNGCNGVFIDTITEPPSLALTAVIVDPSCFLSNGTIIVTPVGGIAPYTYLWSNGVTSSANSGLSAGTPYTVTITDVNTCTFDSTFTLANSGSPVITLISQSDVSCFDADDGSIDIDVSGGIPPYAYFWQGIGMTSQDVNNLSPGTYNVLVTDSTGCSSNAQYTINEPLPIVLTFPLLINTNCGQANGTIIASASGGAAPYTYQWSNGATNDTLFNLSAGSYTATVTDLSGCSVSEIANISDNGGPVIQSVDSTLVTCPGGNNGSITITATGGVAPLTYSWTNIVSNQPAVNNLPANIYTVTVTDAANCQVIRSINITDPDDFVIAATVSQNNPPYNLSCYQSQDGSISVSVTGGTSPYIYIWSTGSNNPNIRNLTAGVYTLIVRDVNNCEAYDTITLTQPPQILANAGIDISICGIDSLVLNADSIAPNLLGHWSTTLGSTAVFNNASAFNTVVDSLPFGSNILTWTVSQLNGNCAVSDDVVVSVTDKITSFAGSDKLDLCGDVYALDATQPQFGSGYWTVLSGTGIIDDTTSSVALATNLSLGSNQFIWTVNNDNCEGKDTVLVFQQDSVSCLSLIDVPNAFSPNGDGYNDYFVIKGIEDYNINSLSIINRWGVEVYNRTNYANEWGGGNEDNDALPDGTYFYILKVEGVSEVFKGFVDLRR